MKLDTFFPFLAIGILCPSVAELSAASLLAPGYSIVGVAATPGSTTSAIAIVGTAGNAYPFGESPSLAIDGATDTKYLNFARINTGFIITIPDGVTTVTGFQFSAANDAPERDPVTVTIEGTSSADPTAAAASANWVLLYSGASGLATDPGRVKPGPSLSFSNSGAFNTYRVLVTGVRNQATANSMQFSEVQFFGSITDATAPTVVNTLPFRGTVIRNLVEVEVFFSEAVDGVDASDLLINGVAANGITYGAPNQFAFNFPQPPTGAVTIAFAANHGIRDQAEIPNPFAGDNWTYLLDPNASGANIVINEFMAAADKVLHDEDGDSSDWIELYNPGPNAANLDGYYLTDAANNLTRWRIPNVSMPANSYLVIFASSKNRTNNPAKLHTNFQLSSGGEYLALVGPLTNVLSDFFPEFPSQQTDISYGRDRLNPATVGYFTTPTPGAANATQGAGFAPEVQFSRDSGTFVLGASFLLTLSTTSSNAAIFYTLGTNLPGTNSFRYTNAIPITGSTLIQARAFQPNSFPGPIATRSYIALTNQTNVLNFKSTLPIMILHNFGKGAVPASKTRQFVVMQTFEPKSGFSSLTNAPDDAEGGNFHVRGSSTAVGSDSGKSGFFLKIQDAFQDKKTIELMGLPDESDWVLYAPNNFEPALIHNPLAFNFARQQGEYASRYRFFELYLKDDSGVPGPITSADYWGVMVLEEKIKRDKNRLDVARLEPEHLNQPEVSGGYIFSIDRTAPGETQLSVTGTGLNWIEPDYEDIVPITNRAPQVTYIRNYFNNFATALNGVNWTNPVSGYAAYMDVDSWVTRHLHEVITFNVDALRLSGYLYKDRNKKIQYGPAWDYDRTQGSTDGRDFNPRVWANGGGTDFFNFLPWWGRLFQSPDFWQRWIDRYQEFRETVYSPTNVIKTIDDTAAQVQEAQPREFARWGRQPRQANGSGGGTYATEIQWKKNWYSNRLDFIDTNFLARPRFNTNGGMIQPGFQLVLTPPAEAGSSMYYTLDGSDPRALYGGIASTAQLYTGPITLSNNTRVVARSYNPAHRNLTGSLNPPISAPWSGPKAATFVVHTPDLIVTELMFHPAAGPAADTNDVDNYEYIELKNIGTNTLNLVGCKFTNGIDFAFTAGSPVTNLAPGGYVLVVKHLAAFTARYGAHTNVAGEYGGNFDNGGERVALVGAVLEPILDFVYQDSWFELADGNGFSLVAQDDTAFSNWSTNTSWRRSSVDGGSPGASNPPLTDVPGLVLVNEVLTHSDPPPPTDTIELYNPGTNDVNIGGWWLTDDFNAPKKYEIPAGTIVPAGDYILFNESQFNPTPGTNNSFALGSDGDQAYVFSGTNGFITGYYHGFDFGAAQNARTFGRYINSQGAEHFVAQATNTLGASNSLPLVGPIVISEIMYHPPESGTAGILADNTFDEFIELYNVSSTNVPLYHTLYPANTWKLTSAVDFSFPLNQSLAPNSFALVVSFDPANSDALAAFRTRYGVPANVAIYGPYSGKLDNSAESVRLRRPDAPNGPSVPFILVDQVDYTESTPWPFQADGLGASLQRLVLGRYGNDPTNWTAARATPGSLIEGGAPPVIVQQPQSITVVEGMTTNLSVVVSSPTTVSYQWRHGSNAIPNATGATLVLTNIQLNQGGNYSVAIFNGGGSTFSASVVLTVRALPVITVQPQPQFVLPGTNFMISVSATGTGPLRYQWRFNGSGIAGATASSISYANAALFVHAGFYDVLVSDDVGTARSLPASLNVRVLPVITNQPMAQTVLQYQTARFSVIAGPDHPMLPINYRWLRQGVNFLSNAPPTLVITNVQPNQAGSFRVTVTNLAGNANSSSVILTVLPDADADGLPDAWETNYFGNATNASAAADSDEDGMFNLGEYIAGTDPLDALSVLKLTLTTTNTGLLTFVAQPTISYTLQYRTNLNSAAWNNITSIAAPSLMQTVQVNVPHPPPEPTRFYRIVTPTAP
jgi:hypothetical protein